MHSLYWYFEQSSAGILVIFSYGFEFYFTWLERSLDHILILWYTIRIVCQQCYDLFLFLFLDVEKINQKEKNISKLRNEFLCMKHQREPFCHDDTGGPLVCANLFNKYVLYGLDIFEKQNCRNPSHYTLFVNIVNHLDWIEGNVYTKYIDPTELLTKFP